MPEQTKKPRLAIHWRILIGLLAGLLVGVAINTLWTTSLWSSLGVNDAAAFLAKTESEQNADANVVAHAARFIRNATDFTGDLFMRALRFVAVPIVLFSLIVGAASIGDPKKLGRIGGKTIGLYLATTAVAITVGLLLANIVGPGNFVSEELRQSLADRNAGAAVERIAQAEERGAAATPWGTLLNLIPTNPFNALAEGKMLQVVTLALLIGLALTRLPEKFRDPVLNFFDGMTHAVIQIVHWIMAIAPYAVFALLVVVVTDLGLGVLGALSAYVAVVILSLAIMIFAVYPSLFLSIGKVGYGRFFKAIAPAQLLAFSSSSSGATLPVTMECVEERLGVSEEITSFVIPIGATINMDGTALYQGVATLFIAQLFGMDLSIAEQLTIVLTATLASIGTAAVPGVGMVMLVIVMQALNFPAEVMTTGVAVIFAVDRLLDMCRTCCNVTGDCMVAAVVAATENELASASDMRARNTSS